MILNGYLLNLKIQKLKKRYSRAKISCDEIGWSLEEDEIESEDDEDNQFNDHTSVLTNKTNRTKTQGTDITWHIWSDLGTIFKFCVSN